MFLYSGLSHRVFSSREMLNILEKVGEFYRKYWKSWEFLTVLKEYNLEIILENGKNTGKDTENYQSDDVGIPRVHSLSE